jgi:hypothetical protein
MVYRAAGLKSLAVVSIVMPRNSLQEHYRANKIFFLYYYLITD